MCRLSRTRHCWLVWPGYSPPTRLMMTNALKLSKELLGVFLDSREHSTRGFMCFEPRIPYSAPLEVRKRAKLTVALCNRPQAHGVPHPGTVLFMGTVDKRVQELPVPPKHDLSLAVLFTGPNSPICLCPFSVDCELHAEELAHWCLKGDCPVHEYCWLELGQSQSFVHDCC